MLRVHTVTVFTSEVYMSVVGTFLGSSQYTVENILEKVMCYFCP